MNCFDLVWPDLNKVELSYSWPERQQNVIYEGYQLSRLVLCCDKRFNCKCLYLFISICQRVMDLLKVIVGFQDKTELFTSTAIIYRFELNGYYPFSQKLQNK